MPSSKNCRSIFQYFRSRLNILTAGICQTFLVLKLIIQSVQAQYLYNFGFVVIVYGSEYARSCKNFLFFNSLVYLHWLKKLRILILFAIYSYAADRNHRQQSIASNGVSNNWWQQNNDGNNLCGKIIFNMIHKLNKRLFAVPASQTYAI